MFNASQKYLTLLLILPAWLILTSPVHAQDARHFPVPHGLVTDFTGTLTEQEVNDIIFALENARSTNSMDGYVIISLSTEEWFLEEYVKDYADYLQGRGQISSTGWLLYISTADRKFSLAVQDLAAESIPYNRKQEIYMILGNKLQNDNLSEAVLSAVDAIRKLPAPETVHEQKKVSPGFLIFAGIAIMVVVLMLRLRKAQKK